jgi:hypothetical protein
MEGTVNYANWLVNDFPTAGLARYFFSSSKSGRYLAANPKARMPKEKMPIEMEISGKDGE